MHGMMQSITETIFAHFAESTLSDSVEQNATTTYAYLKKAKILPDLSTGVIRYFTKMSVSPRVWSFSAVRPSLCGLVSFQTVC